ncbi:hypothetical protein [Actinoplanes regularis]|uniref:hypothetical protein n=1 Tax=Actinoplanes regularis TaxID=52697 RepID=UPI0024A561F3|nr:hypothetical protein [Actinoplanes regularis]GLW36035.1 hypothetical protein Areg01_89700 [Actinoplanes regularis]
MEAWCQVSQSLAAVAALFLAVPGVMFAVSAYKDQQKLNRDQQILNREQSALNAIALDRNERRYASRVSFWDVGTHTDKADMRDEVTQVKVRNMTPLPITDLMLLADPSIRGGLPSLRPGTSGDGIYRPPGPGQVTRALPGDGRMGASGFSVRRVATHAPASRPRIRHHGRPELGERQDVLRRRRQDLGGDHSVA